MAPRKLWIDVLDITDDGQTWTLAEFKELMRETFDKIPANIPDEHTSVVIELDDSERIRFIIQYGREQTPAECVAEEEQRREAATQTERDERKRYEELKAKYEGGNNGS
jgi:hypothetical protein